MRTTIAASFLALALGSCSSAGVNWDNYSPSVKTGIDNAAKSKDCASLQASFDRALANDKAQRSRAGDGNTELMAYIDSKLKGAGCYK